MASKDPFSFPLVVLFLVFLQPCFCTFPSIGTAIVFRGRFRQGLKLLPGKTNQFCILLELRIHGRVYVCSFIKCIHSAPIILRNRSTALPPLIPDSFTFSRLVGPSVLALEYLHGNELRKLGIIYVIHQVLHIAGVCTSIVLKDLQVGDPRMVKHQHVLGIGLSQWPGWLSLQTNKIRNSQLLQVIPCHELTQGALTKLFQIMPLVSPLQINDVECFGLAIVIV
jgi:hypothetical protein